MNISELFHSIQGEGHLTGKPMFFIRAQGCSVKCPIREVCDQPESLGFKGGTAYAPAELAALALAAVGPRGWVSITGGEPLEQPDFDEVVALLSAWSFAVVDPRACICGENADRDCRSNGCDPACRTCSA